MGAREILAACPVVAAPLADITDPPFRRLLREFFPGLIHTEMVSMKALAHGDEKTMRMIESVPREQPPVAIQVMVGDEETARRTARIVAGQGPSHVDVNMACPVKKVTKTGSGCALMDRPAEAAAIVRAIREESGLEVTAKLRLGVDAETAPDLIERLAAAGAAAVTLHGRFARQMYAGAANRARTLEIARTAPLPVIVSGDVYTVEDVRAIRTGGAAGVMAARGMIGRPWFLSEAVAAVRGETAPAEPRWTDVAKRHLDLVRERDGIRRLGAFRQHLVGYTRGRAGAAALRRALVTAPTFEAVERLLEEAGGGG